MYVNKDDFKTSIKTDELDALADGNLDASIKRAEATAFTYLRRLYDIEKAKTKTGDDRDLNLVDIIVSIVIFRLSLKTDMHNVPEAREQVYLRAIQWLRDVGLGRIDLNLPKKEEVGGDKGIVQYDDTNFIDLKNL